MAFINIEGIDGVGKTTLSKNLTHKIQNMGLNVLFFSKKKTLFDESAINNRLEEFRKLIWDSNKENTSSISQYHRFLTIAAMYELLSPTLRDLIDKKKYDLIITDGWHFRHQVKTSLRTGMDINFLGSILDSVVNPDLTLLLELSPEVSWSRREHWEAYETGAWDGYDGQEKENFISYQSNIASQLRGLSHENWVTLDVNDKGETFVTEMAFNKVINQLNI